MLLAATDFVAAFAAAAPALPAELTLAATVLAILVAGSIFGREPRRSGLIAFAGVLVALWLVWLNPATTPTALFQSTAASDASPTGALLVVDSLAHAFRIVLLLALAAVIALWALFDAPRERHSPEFLALIILSALGMLIMSIATNLLVLAVAIELASMPSFALAAFDRRRKDAAEAGVKYVLFGATTSGLSIFGISILFGMFQTLDIATLATRIADTAATLSTAQTALVIICLLTILGGIGFKIAAVPFHFWCPDVFEGASLPVATWLSVASKSAGVILLVRSIGFFAAVDSHAFHSGAAVTISVGVAAIAIITFTFANLAAFSQSSVRRLLAYSSIAHAGYMLAFAAVLSPATMHAAAGGLAIYIAIYALMNIGAFTALALVADDTGSEKLDAFTGLGWRSPFVGVSLAICLLSLIGVPPLGGFIAKFWLIWSLADGARGASSTGLTGANAALWTLIIAIVINTAVSAFYYARVLRQMYLRDPDGGATSLRAPGAAALLLHICAIGLLLAGTFCAPALRSA